MFKFMPAHICLLISDKSTLLNMNLIVIFSLFYFLSVLLFNSADASINDKENLINNER